MDQNSPLLIDIIDPTGFGTGAFNAVYMQMKGQKGRPVKAIVNEYGGNALEGIGIHNLFLGHDARVEAHIPAFAISAHTIVSSGADHVTMPKNGYFMVHNPWSIAVGESQDMQHSAELLDSLKKQIVDIYARKTKLGKKRLSEMMDAETWLSPQEALSMGFVDELVDGADIQNTIRPEVLAAFKNVPAALLQGQPSPKKVEQMTIADQILNTLKGWFNMKHDASGEEVKAEMEKHGNIAAMKATLRTELETELKAAHQAELQAIQATAKKSADDLAASNAIITDKNKEIETLQAKVATLKAAPAGEHTGGKKEEETPKAGKHSEFTERAAAKLNTGKGLPKW